MTWKHIQAFLQHIAFTMQCYFYIYDGGHWTIFFYEVHQS